ncbi:MAG TPA: low-specificity L-threonine aldolase, partial [Pelolinea sp.]|nr:low-specificity L-threonine aldolase [Pelolinea sp.]
MAFKNGIIDLRSDTVTHPTEAMRKAMADAIVGDDVYEEDPTVNQLETISAKLMGKESAIFVASGTMGNLIAVLVHCQRGDEAIMGHLGHTFLHEVGGISALGGIFPHVIQNQMDGTLLLDDVRKAYREEDVHHPESRLVIVENTQNACGGIPVSDKYMHSLKTVTSELNLKIHLDGARIFNAAIALDISPVELTSDADSVMFCLSKGLCAPVGSMLCGSAEFIRKARKIRKQLGGGMRQAGILAAAGLIAVESMTARLSEDHTRARWLAEGLNGITGLEFDKGLPQSNMVFLQLAPDVSKNPSEIQGLMEEEGIFIGQSGPRNFR